MSTPAAASAARTRDAAVGQRPASAPRVSLVGHTEASAALWHYGARLGVEEPDGFLGQLMAVIAAADPPGPGWVGVFPAWSPPRSWPRTGPPASTGCATSPAARCAAAARASGLVRNLIRTADPDGTVRYLTTCPARTGRGNHRG